MICEHPHCDNEVIGKGRGPHKKRFCSKICRTRTANLRYTKKHPERCKKWRRKHPRKFRISMIKSYLRSLTEDELKEVLEGYK